MHLLNISPRIDMTTLHEETDIIITQQVILIFDCVVDALLPIQTT